MKINVLMSTYNGEKYLKEQIDSILGQKGVDVHLTIRDDGSNDDTIDIINDYVKTDTRVQFYKGVNLGPANSFMELLYQSGDYEYYAFADQDDIWLEDKLLRAAEQLEGIKYPCLYSSNQITVDSNGRQIEKRYSEAPPTDLANTMICNRLAGCTMVLNRKLRDILIRDDIRPDPEFLRLRMHDVWVAMIANCFGRVIYDPEAYILYRQHENNVVGAGIGTGISYIRKAGMKGLKAPRRAARELIKTFDKGIKPGERAVAEAFLGLNTLHGKLSFLRNRKLISRLRKSTKNIGMKVILGIW